MGVSRRGSTRRKKPWMDSRGGSVRPSLAFSGDDRSASPTVHLNDLDIDPDILASILTTAFERDF